MKNKVFGFDFDVGDRGSGESQTKWSFKTNLTFLLLVCAFLLIESVECNCDSPKMSETEYRLDFIRNMTRNAWKAYVKVQYPKKDSFSDGDLKHGDHTLAQALSTLWLLNLTAEFAEAKHLLEKEPDFYYRGVLKDRYTFHSDIEYSDKEFVDVANAVAEHIGSMLSCYALTGDEWFREKAQKTANSLKAAYRTKGLPYKRLDMTNLTRPYGPQNWTYYTYSIYNNVNRQSFSRVGGSQHLEYRYLADLTKDPDFDGAVSKIRTILRTIEKPQGLYMTELDYEPPHWSTMKSSLKFTHFYSYLLKSYIQSNFTDHEPMEMFNQAIDAIEAAGMIVKSNQSCNALTIVRDYDVRHRKFDDKMWYSSCNLGAMFGLAVWALKKNPANSIEDSVRMKKYLNWAVELTETCHYAGSRTVNGFVPRWFRIEPNGTINYEYHGDVLSYLPESYFVLYRLTKEPKYRQYAWELAQNIVKHCPRSNGLFRRNVFVDGDNRDRWSIYRAQAFDFIGSTLKYLYLTFTDEDVLPLDQWIFNRAGQPLPIWGRNRMYPSKFGGLRKESEIAPTLQPKKIPDSVQMTKQAKLKLIKNITLEVWKQEHENPTRDGVKGLDLVQMLSTLWVMGLKDEFEEGKRWIEANIGDNFPHGESWFTPINSVVSTEYMASLLSCYALTNDTSWLDKAKLIGDRLKVQFDSATGLPFEHYFNRKKYRSTWDTDPIVSLSDAGGQHLEFAYLADMINDLEMKTKIRTARTYLENIVTRLGLYKYELNVNVRPRLYSKDSNHALPALPSNQFHQYLVKSFIQSNGQDLRAIQTYKHVLDTLINSNNSIIQKFKKKNNQLKYELVDGVMNYNGCSLGAMLALGADSMGRVSGNCSEQNRNIEQHWRLAKEVTEACHIGYNKTKTKLAKQSENFDNESISDYRITFETTAAVAESYFVLWRLTHESKYRDYAWELLQAIHKHCRTEEGRYFHLTDVELQYSRNNYQRPKLNLLGVTLKYLYLTFSEDTLLPLDQWVFNRVGQALPIYGKNPAYPIKKCTKTPVTNPEIGQRLAKIKNMALEVFWQQYNYFENPDDSKYYYGYDHENQAERSQKKGLFMAQMMSGLWVIELREEFELVKQWISHHRYNESDLSQAGNTFEMATEYMGSLLSAYALTSDTNFLNSAKLVGDRLKVEFDTPTGLPNKLMKKLQTFERDTKIHLAEAGGQHLEFAYLADMTNDLEMKAKVCKARTFLHNSKNCHTGLYMHSIDVMTGEWTSTHSSLFWPANTFYQYLIKSYVQSGGKDEQAIEMYREAIDAVLNNNGIQSSGQNPLTNVGPYRIESSVYTDYDGCYLGGMLALGADAMQRKLENCSNIEEQTRIEQHWALAKEITERCHINFRKTKIAKNNLNNGNRAASVITFESTAAMAESYFVLYRLTHNPKYRDYAWELAQVIHKQCRNQDGMYYQITYSRNGTIIILVTEEQPKLVNLLATTLKYLYLTLSDDSVLPLDQWVFNKAGQQLPICGKNAAYPAQKMC